MSDAENLARELYRNRDADLLESLRKNAWNELSEETILNELTIFQKPLPDQTYGGRGAVPLQKASTEGVHILADTQITNATYLVYCNVCGTVYVDSVYVGIAGLRGDKSRVRDRWLSHTRSIATPNPSGGVGKHFIEKHSEIHMEALTNGWKSKELAQFLSFEIVDTLPVDATDEQLRNSERKFYSWMKSKGYEMINIIEP